MLLHINDVHEILKPPPHGLGGLAYVAGYANQVRAVRPDTVFVDAGDILEKGDLMSKASQGEASYRVLGAIELDCTVPGNHDFVFGLDKLLENVKLVNLPIICAGMAYADASTSVFPETMVKQVGELKIGIIGATIPRPIRSARPVQRLDQTALAARVDELAKVLEPEVDLTILVLHNGTWAGRMMAKAAPSVDIVVAGHTNEVTQAPMKAETGALVVSVGRAGQWVGTLDMVVDRDRKRIGKYTYELIPMDHAKINPDDKVAELVDELDKKWTPKDAEATKGKEETGNAPKAALP
jgi:2',3'-cyclic-nucleotide 2'-phosphodiesterase (5'-nucleotidase family)